MKTIEPDGERRVFSLFPVLLVSLLLLSLSACAPKTPETSPISLFTWFQKNQPQQLQLTFDTTILDRANRESGWRDGSLSGTTAQGLVFDIPVQVALRGNTRRTLCDRPPLKIRVDSSIWVGGEQIHRGKLKMVSPCLWESEGEQLLHRERLAYEMYQQITPYSFQTYSTEIEYIPTSSFAKGVSLPVFFLEPKQDLYARLEVEKVKDEVIRNVSGNDYGSFVLFQYFIGNTDWNLSNRHNLVLVKDIEKGRAIPIPYDFDQSGLVNAPYAKPYPTMPINQVTDRMLQWRGKNKEPLLLAIQQFQQLKPSLLESLMDNADLDVAVKAEMKQFLQTFFLDLSRLIPEEEWAETPNVSNPLAS
ncbi:MAG: hypothetical protein AAGH79_15200 [Bacteroidota bacterium]